MRMNKREEYALKAVSVLKAKGQSSTIELAEAVQAPVFYMSQIMRKLRIGGVVKTKRGPGGGYVLPQTAIITAHSVISALGKELVPFVEAPISNTEKVQNAVAEALRGITL